MKYGQEIVINRMYNGNYLNDNLGHEIINMYKADNGENYVYLNALGTFSYEHVGKVGCVLLARTIPGKKMIEIMAKADGITDVYHPSDGKKQQLEYFRKENITYGGVPIETIFDENASQLNQDIYISFKAERVVRPKEATYLKYVKEDYDQGQRDFTSPRNTILLKENNQAKASLKQYFSPETRLDYDTLYRFINDADNWGEETVKVTNERVHGSERNLFEICGMDYNELAFSNALAYFLGKWPSLMRDFAKEVLGQDFPARDYSIVRERENNIDLLIRNDEGDTIVIENKIKSHVNGIQGARDEKGEHSQLEKYYDYVCQKYDARKARFYLLVPDYNDIDLSDYAKGDRYQKIYYSDVHRCMSAKDMGDPRFREFVAAMEKHAKKYDNELYDAMKERFFDAIRRQAKHGR